MSKRKKYAPRIPINISGGIRAQSKRSLYGRPWWSRRWLDVIEGLRLGARLGRGRSYALAGQVSRLTIEPGTISATIHGSAALPYQAQITMQQLDDKGRQHIIDKVRAWPILVGRLLAHDLPQEIESLFAEVGCPLFPLRKNDISTRCSCPDWANPCKHLAAVYFLVGEAIDRNPLLLLAFRGIYRDDLIGRINKNNRESKLVNAGRNASKSKARQMTLPLKLQSFWGAPLPPYTDYGTAAKEISPAPLISRLGSLPFWRGQERFLDVMEGAYPRAATLGWSVWSHEEVVFHRTPPPDNVNTMRLRSMRLRMEVVR